jgi:hypothetical protein
MYFVRFSCARYVFLFVVIYGYFGCNSVNHLLFYIQKKLFKLPIKIYINLLKLTLKRYLLYKPFAILVKVFLSYIVLTLLYQLYLKSV